MNLRIQENCPKVELLWVLGDRNLHGQLSGTSYKISSTSSWERLPKRGHFKCFKNKFFILRFCISKNVTWGGDWGQGLILCDLWIPRPDLQSGCP
jgi:hypothetical protein